MQLCNFFDIPADEIFSKMNQYGSGHVPFFFMVDFEITQGRISTLEELPEDILLKCPGYTHEKPLNRLISNIDITKSPLSLEEYKHKFDIAMEAILYGDSFLLNLCVKTPINTTSSLEEIYHAAQAKYKFCLPDELVCFSPECFVEIKEGRIYSYPMKGTIDADLADAEEKILADEKELAEHYTIVDLIRNDLNMVSTEVIVERFRYIDCIKTSKKNLLQVSSEISGKLPEDYIHHIGDIIRALLPAGSISGAPKKRTLEIIDEAENEKRGYYTGICGIFDGRNLNTAVMIRYIEQQGRQLFYRSGCGITCNSELSSEYNEMLDKIYVPIG